MMILGNRDPIMRSRRTLAAGAGGGGDAAAAAARAQHVTAPAHLSSTQHGTGAFSTPQPLNRSIF